MEGRCELRELCPPGPDSSDDFTTKITKKQAFRASFAAKRAEQIDRPAAGVVPPTVFVAFVCFVVNNEA